MTPPGLPGAFLPGLCNFRSGRALFCHFQWLRQTVSCALCFTYFSHPGLCCLPLPMRKLASSILSPSFPKPHWPFLGWFWPWASWRPQRSLHPSAPHAQSQNKAGEILRNFRSIRCLRMDETLSLTYVFFYTLSAISYFTVLEIQKIHNSFGHCSFAWNNKGRKLERRQPEGTEGPSGKKLSCIINLDI